MEQQIREVIGDDAVVALLKRYCFVNLEKELIKPGARIYDKLKDALWDLVQMYSDLDEEERAKVAKR